MPRNTRNNSPAVSRAADPYARHAARYLTAHGYGRSAEEMGQVLGQIPNLREFLYTLARLAEKQGEAAFWKAHERES